MLHKFKLYKNFIQNNNSIEILHKFYTEFIQNLVTIIIFEQWEAKLLSIKYSYIDRNDKFRCVPQFQYIFLKNEKLPMVAPSQFFKKAKKYHNILKK